MKINNIRKNYQNSPLPIHLLKKNPIEQFTLWLQEAKENKEIEYNAMTLATAQKNGVPSSRTVLLKDFNKQGFFFFTNYNSKKAKEIKENPYASLTFFWKTIEKQVTISGSVIKIKKEESNEYFSSRPKNSQLAAWASKQDTIIPSREHLLSEFKKYEELYKEKPIPYPSCWGGFQIIPSQFEFWIGLPDRLHDRFQYSLENKEHNSWKIVRLSP